MTDSQAWVTLLIAIAAEIAGTSLLKLSEGLTRLWPTVLLLAVSYNHQTLPKNREGEDPGGLISLKKTRQTECDLPVIVFN